MNIIIEGRLIMRKNFITVSLILTLMFTACSSQKPNTQNTTPQITTENKDKSTQQKVFTLDELKKYNGENGNPAYVAVDGVVYDVTNARKWKNGKHQGVTAGNDLSKAIGSSPHGKNVLNNLPVMGTLKQS
jgi:Predicted heme/steroid binding protein